ncbi:MULTISPECIES: malectin domain-containing carbohydrate-binding protein [Acidobacterium]|nr:MULTISPECIES: malectin domain-containing carbohydrate-binding protein [Acidobacterium]
MSDQYREANGSSHAETREAERRELEAFAATLAKPSRMLSLITYIGEKYFADETEKLREYEIATEVFDRSKNTFNSGEDAIVRVEAHRLRKRLKKYYDTDGQDHAVQFTIPAGSYVPVFSHRVQPQEDGLEDGVEQPEDAESPVEERIEPTPRKKRGRVYVIAAILLVALLVGAGALVIYRQHRRRISASPPTAGNAPIRHASASGPFPQMPLRILAGYKGKPQIDNAGAVWQPDEYYHGGGSWDRPESYGPVRKTSDPLLFQHWREGNFSYDIPLPQGVYDVHLFFVSAQPYANTPSTFNVLVNGKAILPYFDVNMDAMGPDVADERVFRDVSPGPDGVLHLSFTSYTVPASVNAIEIVPGEAHHELPIRIVAQSRAYTDHSGALWEPDDYYSGGYTSETNFAVTETADPELYAAERYGYFSYSIPVDARDQYTLILHFAELYFGPNRPGGGGAGSRVFRIECNGQTLDKGLDIYKSAGSMHALTETFHHLVPTPQGKLNVTFDPIENNATVSAIEVVDEGPQS